MSSREWARTLPDDAELMALRAGTLKTIVFSLLEGGLAPSTINQKLSAIRALASEAADNGLLDPQLAAGVARVRGVPSAGTRTGNWLSQVDAQRLLDAPDPATRKGVRDRASLATLLGCGLRRSEIAALTLAHVQQRDGRWVIVDLVGKHRRVRSVPMPNWTRAAIEAWTERAGIVDGHVFRSLRKGDGAALGVGMSSQAIADVVSAYAEPLGIDVAPHDCRRRFAKLALKGGAWLEQIQLSPGHASIRTTERCLRGRADSRWRSPARWRASAWGRRHNRGRTGHPVEPGPRGSE